MPFIYYFSFPPSSSFPSAGDLCQLPFHKFFTQLLLLFFTSFPYLCLCTFPSAFDILPLRIFHTWQECERLLADGLVDAAPVISHRLPMSQFEHAFHELINGAACKIILDPQN